MNQISYKTIINRKMQERKKDNRAFDSNAALASAVAWGTAFYRTSRWKTCRKNALKVYGRKCHRCDNNDNIHVDHIKPRSKFPQLAFDLENLQILCRECNSSKGNHVFIDYRSPKAKLLMERFTKKNNKPSYIIEQKRATQSRKRKIIQCERAFLKIKGRHLHEFCVNTNNLYSKMVMKYSPSVVDEAWNNIQGKLTPPPKYVPKFSKPKQPKIVPVTYKNNSGTV